MVVRQIVEALLKYYYSGGHVVGPENVYPLPPRKPPKHLSVHTSTNKLFRYYERTHRSNDHIIIQGLKKEIAGKVKNAGPEEAIEAPPKRLLVPAWDRKQRRKRETERHQLLLFPCVVVFVDYGAAPVLLRFHFANVCIA